MLCVAVWHRVMCVMCHVLYDVCGLLFALCCCVAWDACVVLIWFVDGWCMLCAVCRMSVVACWSLSGAVCCVLFAVCCVLCVGCCLLRHVLRIVVVTYCVLSLFVG